MHIKIVDSLTGNKTIYCYSNIIFIHLLNNPLSKIIYKSTINYLANFYLNS